MRRHASAISTGIVSSKKIEYDGSKTDNKKVYLVGRRGIGEIKYLNVTFSCPHNHERILDIKGIAALR